MAEDLTKSQPLTGNFQPNRKDQPAGTVRQVIPNQDEQPKVTAPTPKAPVFTPPASGVRPHSGQAEGGQRPSLGRIVLYHHDMYEGGCSPAIITALCKEQGVVDITVFFKNQAPYGISDVKQGDDVDQWNWPPRV